MIGSSPPPPPALPRVATDVGFQHVDEISSKLVEGGAFERVQVLSGSSYRDNSTIMIAPSRDPFIHWQVWTRWSQMIKPMNQKFHMMMCVGDEVGIAYNNMIAQILADPNLSKWKYVLTVESDNLIPPDAHVRLIESINKYQLDAVSGIYFTKGEVNMPMAYGDAEKFRRTGELEFTPLDIRSALSRGDVVEVNGIAMGCSLYRMDIFRDVPAPWFVTVSDMTQNGPMGFTQDLYFCKNAKARGKRFGVDMRVKVGHMDLTTGEVY